MSFNEELSIPVSLLRQYAFCPRIPFFNEVLKIEGGNRTWLAQGVSYHDRQLMLNKRRNLSRFTIAEGTIKHNITLKSSSIPLHGVCDAVIFTPNQLFPVEFKLSSRAPTLGHKLQLAAYGMLLEEGFNKPCPKGFILYGEKGKTISVEFDTKLRNQVRNVVNAILNMYESNLTPHSSATSTQCGQCEYLNFCADRE